MKTFQRFIAEAKKFGGMGSISSPVYSIPDDPNFKKKYAEKQRLIAARKRTAEPTKMCCPTRSKDDTTTNLARVE